MTNLYHILFIYIIGFDFYYFYDEFIFYLLNEDYLHIFVMKIIETLIKYINIYYVKCFLKEIVIYFY